MTKAKYDVRVSGVSVEAVFNRLGGPEGAQALLRGDVVVSEPERSWRGAEPTVIYFTVTSDGTTGAEWIARLEREGYNLNRWSKDVLMSEDFKPTNGVTYEVAVLVGALWSDNDRVTKKIRSEATEQRNFLTPHPEIACLIRLKFSDEELEAMGLMWIVVLHEPINDSGGNPSVLVVSRLDGGRWLDADYDDPGLGWGRDDGFAFVVSQVSAQD